MTTTRTAFVDEQGNPSLFKNQALRGGVFANPHGSSTSSWFGSGPPIVA